MTTKQHGHVGTPCGFCIRQLYKSSHVHRNSLTVHAALEWQCSVDSVQSSWACDQQRLELESLTVALQIMGCFQPFDTSESRSISHY